LLSFAPIGALRFVKRETENERETLSVIVETKKRIFLWRASIDANGKIAELILEEEE